MQNTEEIMGDMNPKGNLLSVERVDSRLAEHVGEDDILQARDLGVRRPAG